MRSLRLAAAALILGLGLSAPAMAQQIYSPADAVQLSQSMGLQARVMSFDAAMRANDMSTIMGVVPPKILDAIAAQYNVSTTELIGAMQAQMDEAMKAVKLVSFSMDIEKTEFYRLPDDTLFAYLPTETVMDLGDAGGKVRAKSTTLGLLDGETWYLVRVEDPQQVALLKQTYPAFADVTFPTGSMEPVTE
jgi:hypothetical protein